MFTVYVPVPVPLLAWLFDVVGLWLVPQQIPRSVTLAPPVAVTLPPPVAEVWVMLVTWLVVTVGKPAVVVKLTSLPYAVPWLLMA
jgi:hypothetical protein